MTKVIVNTTGGSRVAINGQQNQTVRTVGVDSGLSLLAIQTANQALNIALGASSSEPAFNQANLAYSIAANAVQRAGDTMTGLLRFNSATGNVAVGPIQFDNGIDLFADENAYYAQLNWNNTNFVYVDSAGTHLNTGNNTIDMYDQNGDILVGLYGPTSNMWIGYNLHINAYGDVTTPGNVSAQYLYANGAYLTGIVTDFSPAFNQANAAFNQANTANSYANKGFLKLRNSNTIIDGATGNVWGGSFSSGLRDTYSGIYNSNNSTALFTMASGGGNVMSLQLDGSVFVGENFVTDALGVVPSYGGWIVASSGIKSAYNIYAGADVQADGNFVVGQNINFPDGSQQNTAYKPSVYNTANTALLVAQAAYNNANSKFSSSGGQISGDVSITGNLSVSGNTAVINVTNYAVEDSLIYLADKNYTSDILYIGFVANYNNGACATVHTGLMRSPVTKQYYLFQGYDKEPANNFIDISGNNFSVSVLNADIYSNNLWISGVNAQPWIASSYNQANAAYNQANAAFLKANTANITADLAFNKANAANIIASLAYDQANAANLLAFNTGIGANSYATVVGTSANSYAATVGAAANTIASAAFDKANSANVLAFNTGIGANSYANSTFVQLNMPGQTIVGNISITGSLTVSGNTYKVDANTLVVQDPLIYLAGNNYTSDIVDIGFVANYNNGACSTVHTGLVRDYISKEYYLFHEYNQEPVNNFIDTAGNNFTLSVLNSTVKTSNLILGGTNAITWIASSFNKANSGNIIASAAFDKANAANILAFNALANTNGTFNGNLTIAGAITANNGNNTSNIPVLDLSQIWGSASVTYTGIRYNTTNIGSSSTALLMDLRRDNISQFSVDKGGGISVGGGITLYSTITFNQAGNKGILSSVTPDTIQMGAADAAAPVTQNLIAQSVVGGTTDTAGINFFIAGSKSTGTGAGGALIFQTANAAAATASTQNPLFERMRIDQYGNVSIGTTSTAYKLQVNGSFAAVTKSFVISHPTKSGYMLRHGSLEGPENGVYVRGRTQSDIIELPDYWTKLIDENTITVSLTPIGTTKMPSIKAIQDNVIYLNKPWFSSIDCYYHVFAERKDVEKLVVEISENG